MLQILKNPFRLYFPIGILFGLWGIFLWVLFFYQKVSYPGIYHAEMMIFGFYTHIAMGFLMTAIPRFTGTNSMTRAELAIGLGLSIVFFIVAFRDLSRAYLPFLFFAEISFLLAFFVRRLFIRQSNPPPTFAFLFAGLVCAFIGGLAVLLNFLDITTLKINGYDLIYYGWTMGPMLGVGGMLIPRIVGYLNQQIQPVIHTKAIDSKRPYRVMGIWACIFLVSQFGFAIWQLDLFLYLRQLVLSVVFLKFWKIYKWPPNKGYLIKGLWLSSWFFLLGTWLATVDPSRRIHDMHFYFVGAVSLMIGCIATRVVVAHGNYPSTDESHSKWLLGVIVFLILAMLTRVLAPWTKGYFMHLAVASFLWSVAYLCWTIKYVPRIFLPQKESSKTNC